MSDIYVVEKIIDQRVRQGKKQYYVKWKDYPDCDNTWEPEGHLYHGKEPCEALEAWINENEKSGRNNRRRKPKSMT